MAFRDIIGQDRALRILVGTLRRGRMPSSYLFAGESGIGKKLTAITLAKTLNCIAFDMSGSASATIDCCDACPSCKKIDAQVHPDFRVIRPESGLIRIEEIRAIEDILSFKAFEGKMKTVIVDEAETMNQFAANAFLKTLEEPPEHSLIVLVTSNPDRLPDTIRSRCSRINFTPLPCAACEDVIRRSMDLKPAEKGRRHPGRAQHEISESHLKTLARLAMGKPGDALSEDLVDQRTMFISMLRDMIDMGKDRWASREDMEKWFDMMLILIRDVAVMKITRDAQQLINADREEVIAGLGDGMELKGIIELYQRLITLKRQIYFNLNKSLTWNYTGSVVRQWIGELHA